MKDKHLTATYNLIALNIEESFRPHRLCAVLKRIFSKRFILFFLLHQLEQPSVGCKN